jgi:hypothetical protein
MPIIHQAGLDEIIAVLPEVEPFGKSPIRVADRKILLFAAAGFEDRACVVAAQFDPDNWDDLILVHYPTNEPDNEQALALFRQLAVRGKIRELLYDRAGIWQDLNGAIDEYGEGDGCVAVVDVSGMASYVLYPVLEAIWRRLPRARLAVLYIEADEYHPKKDVWETFRNTVSDLSNSLEIAERYQQSGKFESQGPTVVYASQVFPGSNVDSLATQLIAIPSFSLERMKEMVAFAEDQYNVTRDEILWIFGKPPDRQKNGWRLDAQIELFCAKDDQQSRAISTRNYADMLRLLDEAWEESSTTRHIVIATVGSKMQHVATFLFLCMHQEAGLILSEPKEFIAKQYSDGCGPTWWLDFGPIEDLRRLLESRGELRFQW